MDAATSERIIDWVDPFIGTEAIDLPEPQGIARTWFYLKAQIGNTHPGPCLPFSSVSVCPYSGGYPSGYGRYDINGHGRPPRLYDRKGAFGVTHVQHSGTGYIGVFYNYLLVMPFCDGKPKSPPIDLLRSRPFLLENERAAPGYYAGRLPEIGVSFQLTVGRQAAAHRYRFHDHHFHDRRGGPAKALSGGASGLVVDVTNGGLAPLRAQARPKRASISVLKDGSVTGTFEHYGVLWFYALICATQGTDVGLWKGARWRNEAEDGHGLLPLEELTETESLQMGALDCKIHRAGIALRTAHQKPIELYVGFSLVSEESALEYAGRAASAGFDGLRRDAEKAWEEHLGRIYVTGGNDASRRIFYTALYHSFIKPVESESTNFLWKDGPPLYADFATMWDQYKTLLPLIFTVCPERIAPMVRSFVEVEKTTGALPPGLLLSKGTAGFHNQSRGLCHVALWDAYQQMSAAGSAGTLRGGTNWNRVVDAMADTLDDLASSVRPGEEKQSYSHLLDVGYAAYCTFRLAEVLGRKDAERKTRRHLDVWLKAFDPDTGMMREGDYYEGGNVHYSFRLLHDMEKRIALCGGKEAFLRRLDAFFGSGSGPVEQLGDPPWEEAREAGLALGRFDGLNNEIAIETPYAYSYIGRHERTAEVVAAIMRYQFSDRSGGLPGNDDSGALSSWFVWNAVGLFPVPGQGIFLVGNPLFEKIDICIGSKKFRIRVMRSKSNAVYLSGLRLNAHRLKRTFLQYEEVLSGGELEIELVDKAGVFAVEELPPSYSLRKRL